MESFENASEINPSLYEGTLRLLVYHIKGKILYRKSLNEVLPWRKPAVKNIRSYQNGHINNQLMSRKGHENCKYQQNLCPFQADKVATVSHKTNERTTKKLSFSLSRHEFLFFVQSQASRLKVLLVCGK